MNDALLATTSTEGLQPLGTAPQRSFELVRDTLKERLGPKHAALFAEPVASEAGDRIDWYSRLSVQASPLPELPEAVQGSLHKQLGVLIGDIRDEAEALANSDVAEDHRLSEALLNAIEVPEEGMIYGVKSAKGDWQPVLVHWSWVRNEQAAVRGILTGMVPRASPLQPASVAASDKNSPGWWWLILLGWLLLAAILAAILYLLIAPCGVNRFGLVYCPAERIAAPDPFEEESVTSDEIARLQHELALADRACQPSIPIMPATPARPGTPAPPVVPDAQEDETKTDADRSDVESRIAERGAALGALNFVLEWATVDDVDLFVTCPTGETISYSNRAGCGGRYDLDANVAEMSAVKDPVENIVFENPARGLYKVKAHLRGNRTGGDKTVTLHVLRKDGPSQSFSGTLGAEKGEWTVNISISR